MGMHIVAQNNINRWIIKEELLNKMTVCSSLGWVSEGWERLIRMECISDIQTHTHTPDTTIIKRHGYGRVIRDDATDLP